MSRVCTVVLVAAITGFRVVGSWRCFVTLRESLKGNTVVRRLAFFGYHRHWIKYGRFKRQGENVEYENIEIGRYRLVQI